LLAPIPSACFAGALLTDIAYWRSTEIMWANFSAWLISAGVIVGYLGAIVGLIDLLNSRVLRPRISVWPYLIGNAVALILATINMLVHTRDAWTSVVPWGLALSAAVTAILLITGLMGWSMILRPGTGGTGR
jgi:uncharacterized membrane protein